MLCKMLHSVSIRGYNSTPTQKYTPRFRALLGRITPYIVVISSLNLMGKLPSGGGDTSVTPESSYVAFLAAHALHGFRV